MTEALEELGYADFAEDLCTSDEALRARDVGRCEALASTVMREACVRRVAVLAHAPDLCPRIEARGGREPLCLAWAARDARLCELAPRPLTARCLAVLRDDPRLCRRPTELDRGRCESLVRRYASATSGGSRPSRALVASQVELRARVEPGTQRPIVFDAMREPAIDVRAEGCDLRARFTLTSAHTPDSLLPVTAEISLRLPRAPRLPLALAPGSALEVEVVGLRTERVDARIGASGALRLDALTLERAGSLRATVDLVLQASSERIRLEGTLELPIRDLDPAPAQCAGPTSR